MSREPLVFYSLPPNVPSRWKNYFQAAEIDLVTQAQEASDEFTFEKFIFNRHFIMSFHGFADVFAAMSAAEMVKNKGNDYFHQGIMRGAEHMYKASLHMVPSPTPLLNLTAIMNRECDFKRTVSMCSRIEAMEPTMILAPPRKAKMLYRRAIAFKCLAKEVEDKSTGIADALRDLKEAVRLYPKDTEIAAELVTLQHLSTLSELELNEALQKLPNYRNYYPDGPLDLSARKEAIEPCCKKELRFEVSSRVKCVDDVLCKSAKNDLELQSMKEVRDNILDFKGLDQFDAVLTAQALRNEADDLFRQGDSRRACLLYQMSSALVPLPTTFVNWMAALNKECHFEEATWSAMLSLEAIKHHLPPALKVKILYEDAVAWKHLAKENSQLGPTLEPVSDEGLNNAWVWDIMAIGRAGKFLDEAKVIEPDNAAVIAELEVIDRLFKIAVGSSLKEALEPFAKNIPVPLPLPEDFDFMSSTAERVRTTYPESFDYRTEGPPPFL
ncbi:hypothetical protein C8J56DRAFT_1109654 [Mycena floridula]|nr:hypothetical protein C8J56DRAFT_1109654 [Mycena floridula]